MRNFLYIFISFISFNISARQLEEASTPTEILQSNRLTNADVTFQLPRFIFTYTNTRVIVKFINPNNLKLVNNNYELDLIVNGTSQKVVFDNNGIGNFYYTFKNEHTLHVLLEDINYNIQPSVISIWYIISPLFIGLALFIYRIVRSVKKNKIPKLIVKRNLEPTPTTTTTYSSNLKVVRTKEEVEEEV